MDQLPSLRRPAEEVRRLLAGRIEAGQELLDRVHAAEGTPSRSTDDELSEAFHSWDRYNDALLGKELLDEEPYTAASDEERDAYFHLLYERTGGRTDQTVASKDIGAALGLTDEVRSDVEDFLGSCD